MLNLVAHPHPLHPLAVAVHPAVLVLVLVPVLPPHAHLAATALLAPPVQAVLWMTLAVAQPPQAAVQAPPTLQLVAAPVVTRTVPAQGRAPVLRHALAQALAL